MNFEALLVVIRRNRHRAGCARVVHLGWAPQAGPRLRQCAQQAILHWLASDKTLQTLQAAQLLASRTLAAGLLKG
jgi:hypothetical protein